MEKKNSSETEVPENHVTDVEEKTDKELSVSDQNTSCAKLELQLYEHKDDLLNKNVNASDVPKKNNKRDQTPNPSLPPNASAAQNNYILEQRHAKKKRINFTEDKKESITQEERGKNGNLSLTENRIREQPDSIIGVEETPAVVRFSEKIPGQSKEKFVDFLPMNDYDLLFNRSKDQQNVIDAVRKKRPESCKGYKNINLIPVDWLGVPLASSTLPNFKSTSKLDFQTPNPTNIKEIKPLTKLTRSFSTNFYDQFPNLKWIPQDLTPKNLGNGHKGKLGQMSKIIAHPKSSIWNVPETYVEKIKKSDPMEYLNLLDPKNIISTEKAAYDWILRDQGEIGTEVIVGNSVKSSGFANNRQPHLPPDEERDFKSVYKKSYCTIPILNDIEGLAETSRKSLGYPGYEGGTSMRDIPSSFVRFAPNLLKENPSFLECRKSRIGRSRSARPIP